MKRPSLRLLFLASFSGRVVYAIASLATLPFFAGSLGVEVVGLIGFFNTLLMVMMVLEGGLTSSLINLIAKNNQKKSYAPKRYEMHSCSVINSFFIIFFVLGVIVSSSVGFLAPYLAEQWLNAKDLPVSVISDSIEWMGVFVGLNFLVVVAQGVLAGREQQVSMNFFYVVYAVFRTVGVVLLFLVLDEFASAVGYFKLQVCFQAVYLISLLVVVYKGGGAVIFRVKPNLRFFMNGSKYSASIFALSITSVLVVQFDKFYLSGFVSLDDYAAYSLASTIAGVPYVLSSALYSVLFPRFSTCIAKGRLEEVEGIFRSAICGVAILMLVFCIAIWMFSIIPLRLLFDYNLAEDVSSVLPTLIVGVAIQSLLMVPFALQLANRWTTLALRLNLLLVPIFLILLPLMVKEMGVVGAAYAWLVYNGLSFFGTIFFMVRRFEYIASSFWVIRRVLGFMIPASLVIFYLVNMVVVDSMSDMGSVLLILLASIFLVLVGFLRFRRELVGFS